jgi:hypothetical protein
MLAKLRHCSFTRASSTFKVHFVVPTLGKLGFNGLIELLCNQSLTLFVEKVVG